MVGPIPEVWPCGVAWHRHGWWGGAWWCKVLRRLGAWVAQLRDG